MSTSVIEPGTRLAGRYRLEERVNEASGSTLWKAVDEILARPVAVRTFDPDFPRAAEVVTAARAASRLTDPRLTQVFDADDSGESAYVVSEWTQGESLETMLGKAPLEPGRAATLLYEAAEAIGAAHAAGLAHLCLSPRDLLWTTGGTVKLLGIAVDAALGDIDTADPALEDTRALGRMLYAAVTAHWPGEPVRTALPTAPEADGVVCAPRQVQAGVSQALDSIICRALDIRVPAGQEPLNTPAELSAALRTVPRTPLPLFTGLPGGPPPAVRRQPPQPSQHAQQATNRTVVQPQPQPQQVRSASQMPAAPATMRQPAAHTAPQGGPGLPGLPGGPGHRGSGRGGSGSRPLIALAAAALTVIAGVGAWSLLKGGGDDNPGAKPSTSSSPSSKAADNTPVKLDIQSVRSMDDPIGGHSDTTIVKDTNAVRDNNPATVWNSQTYHSEDLGRLVKGLGVLLDLGSTATIKSVTVNIPSGATPGTLQLRVGDNDSLGSLRVVDRRSNASGSVELQPEKTARGRYVLLWFTDPAPAGFKAQISGVEVRGSTR